MVSDKDADIFFLETIDNSLDIFNGDRIDTGKWFVEHYELWVDGKTACNLSASSLTSGKLVAKILPHLLKTELSNQAFELFFLILLCSLCHLQDRADVILHGHLSENGRLLSEITDASLSAFVDRVLSDIEVVEEDFALICLNKSYSHIESGSLSSTVRSKQTNNLPLLDIDRDMVDDSTFAIFLDQIVGPKHHSARLARFVSPISIKDRFNLIIRYHIRSLGRNRVDEDRIASKKRIWIGGKIQRLDILVSIFS